MILDNKQISILNALIKTYYNFPITNITFKDLSLIYDSPTAMNVIKDVIVEYITPLSVDCVIGCDARGFILGTLVSSTLNLPFVMARKPGKLPGDTIKQSYNLEYGSSEIQMHEHIISKYKSPIICDDILATGGTSIAVSRILKKININNMSYFFIMEISELNGRDKLIEYSNNILSLIR